MNKKEDKNEYLSSGYKGVLGQKNSLTIFGNNKVLIHFLQKYYLKFT